MTRVPTFGQNQSPKWGAICISECKGKVQVNRLIKPLVFVRQGIGVIGLFYLRSVSGLVLGRGASPEKKKQMVHLY